MAVLTVQDCSVAGITPAPVAAAGGGDQVPNNGNVVLEIINGSGGAITVTVDDPGTPTPVGASAFNPDVATSIPAGQRRLFGPYPPWRFNDANGRLSLTYSGVTSLTVGVYRTRT